jgi:hypothetical protein
MKIFMSTSILILNFWSVWDSIISPEVSDVSILLLIVILVAKELLLSMEGKWRSFAWYLNIPIVILLIIFVLELIREISRVSGNGG